MQSQNRSASTTLAFHASRIVIDVGVLLTMASMSLAFVKAPGGNRSALQGDALAAVLLLLPIFLITLIPDHTRPLPRPLSWASLVLGLAAFPYAIVKHLDAAVLADTLGGSVGMGARLLVFGTFATVVGIIIGLTRSFMGLPTGGAPTRRAHATARKPPAPGTEVQRPDDSPTMVAPTTRGRPETPADAGSADDADAPRRPAKSEPESSPFGEPLFDSLEIPAFVAPSDDAVSSTLIFEAETASERVANDEPDPRSED